MAIEVQVLAQVVDSEPENPMNNGILFKSGVTTVAVAPEDTNIANCFAIARARLDTIVAEVSADLREQLKVAEEGVSNEIS